MSNDDEIARLLREVDGITGQQPSRPPAQRPGSDPVPVDKGHGQGLILAISATIGVLGILVGLLPFVPNLWLGIGGFLGSWLGATLYRRFG